jgi:HEPN domain-containing protein
LQQAVEKRLKAALCHRCAPCPRTHDIQTLLDLLERSGAVAPPAVSDAVELTPFAVVFRYDDVPATDPPPDLTRLYEMVRMVREWTATLLR